MNVSHPIHPPSEFTEMLLKTILNSVTDYKSFRFGKMFFEKKGEPDQPIVVGITPRKNSKPTCDTAREPRRFEFISLTDVVREAVQSAFDRLGVVKIFAPVFEFNTASKRVLEKAGFQLEGILRKAAIKEGKIIDLHYYGAVKPR